MEWTTGLIIAVVIVGYLLWRRMSLVREPAARTYLAQGAKVIDVRSFKEYQAEHLPGVLHIPLVELRERITREVPDKSQVILLHCLSGGRSAIGRRMLKQLGYRRAYNLGSYNRAARVILA